MSWIQNKNFIGFFGNITDDLQIHQQYHHKQFHQLIQKIQGETQEHIDCLFFPKQIHTKAVTIIDHHTPLEKPLHLFHKNADAIITKEKNIAIGVATADCLPIFFYDEKNHAIGVIHAGWKGLAAAIISATISAMQTKYGTDPADLTVYLGPSAGVCCYEIQTDFLGNASKSDIDINKYVEKRSKKLFFDPKHAAISELQNNKISPEKINTQFSVCTICHDQYCSVRRQKEKAGRQPSIILLRN